jgi:hypothetical protein
VVRSEGGTEARDGPVMRESGVAGGFPVAQMCPGW